MSEKPRQVVKKNHQTVDSAKVKPLKCYSSQMWRKNIIRNAWGGRAMLIKFLFRWISLLNIRSLAVATTKPFCSTWADFSGVRYAGRWNKKKVQSFPRDCSRFHSKTMIFFRVKGSNFSFCFVPKLKHLETKIALFCSWKFSIRNNFEAKKAHSWIGSNVETTFFSRSKWSQLKSLEILQTFYCSPLEQIRLSPGSFN